MPGSDINAGPDAGPNQTWCGAGSVLGSDFGEILTSLTLTYALIWAPEFLKFSTPGFIPSDLQTWLIFL